MLIPRLPESVQRLLDDKEELAKIAFGRTSRQLPAIIGCSRATILRALKRHGLSNAVGLYKKTDQHILDNKSRNMPSAAIGFVDNKEWLEEQYLVKNRSARDIGQEFGLSKTATYRWIYKFKLKKDKLAQLKASAAGYLAAQGFAINSPEASRKRMGGRRALRVDTIKGGDVMCHSGWEERAAYILDGHPNVVEFKKDPFPIPYCFNGNRLYWPDFIIECRSKTLILEIKADRLLGDAMVVAKMDAGSAYARNNGYQWCVVGGGNHLRVDDLVDLLNAS